MGALYKMNLWNSWGYVIDMSNATVWVYGAWIRIYYVLCWKTYNTFGGLFWSSRWFATSHKGHPLLWDSLIVGHVWYATESPLATRPGLCSSLTRRLMCRSVNWCVICNLVVVQIAQNSLNNICIIQYMGTVFVHITQISKDKVFFMSFI